MWLTRYTIPMEIMYDQGLKIIGPQLKDSIIEKIKDNFQAKNFDKSYF